MKKTPMWCLVVLLSLGSAERLVAQGTSSSEEAVEKLEGRLVEAKATCNSALLAQLLADKVVIVGNEGKISNKTEMLETCINTKTKWDIIRLRDMKLTVFGNTVVATVDFKGEGIDTSGKPFDMHERWTHTWVKMPSGQWQCAAIHTSPVTM